MPTYDYICRSCDHEFEFFQSMSSPVKKKCPECGKLKLERLVGTGAAVIFKGSGFYETDYRSDGYKKAAKADQDSSKKSDDQSGGGGNDSSKSPKADTKAKADTKSDGKKSSSPTPEKKK